MVLELQHSKISLYPPSAAIIRGGSPAEWLREISTWQIPIEDLECYILPSSISNISPAGLFVIFRKEIAGQKHHLLDTYGEFAKGIYLPVNSALTPATTAEELKKICLWKVQVFHPHIGLIGFETSDQLNLIDLINTESDAGKDWSFAHPGIPARPAFTQINILQPGVQEIIDDFKKEIDAKPFSEILKKNEQKNGLLYKILNWIKWAILLLTFFIARLLKKLLPKSTGTYTPSSNKKPIRLFDKLEQWINKNLEELEKKRDSELKRLTRMFDENTDEALQYAIPLDSPYMNRGKAQKSDTLYRRPFNFNLGKLGGGGAADIWDVGHHYNDLRTKYIKAAQREIERKDFKKAAYIYAHLLGDYHSAANTLQQGQYYREAATLYKDHLKNIPAAAACLEKGGLYLESIELYKQLHQHEKVGDLYNTINLKKEAESFYEQTVDIKLQNNDYLDAGRVIKDKLNNADRAKQTLLNGWDNEGQSENCLKNYFGLIRETENEDIEQKVQEVYRHRTPKQKKKKFLEVLKDVYKKKKDTQEEECYQHIAYEITSEQAADGNLHALNDLSHFFSGDRLISSDCSRYINNQRNKYQQKRSSEVFHLDASIKWQKAAWHRNQFLVTGIKNGVLHMARCNWDENIEYFSWTNPVKPNTYFHFVSSPYHSNHVILYSSGELPVTRKNLLKNKYFPDALIINCPIWLHKRKTQFLLNEQNEIVLLDIADGKATLHHYNMDGDLKKSVNCRLHNNKAQFTLPASNNLIEQREAYYYTYSNKDFFVIEETGDTKNFSFQSIIRTFGISQLYTKVWIVISTNQGCILCMPMAGKLNPFGDIFAAEFIPTSIVFIATDLFVLVEKKRAILFQIQNETPKLLLEFETHNTIISAMPTSSRYRFLLLEETGRMSFCETGLE